MRHLRSHHASLAPLTSILLVMGATSTAAAAPSVRAKVDQRGDFILFGNTLGMECDNGAPAVTVGSSQCGPSGNRFGQPDSPDIYWRSDSPGAGQAESLQSLTAAQARSTAVIALPAGATVTHAYLYWSGAGIGNAAADTDALIERPGVFSQAVTAIDSYKVAAQAGSYASVADVTALLQAHGSGAYRVGGVASNIVNQDDRWAGWWVVVFYERPADPPRNLVLSDMFDFLQAGTPITSSLTDFLVPAAGFDAKLGVVAFEGDGGATGDRLFFNPSAIPAPNGEALSNALNPANDFFNSSRTHLGAAVSHVGDLPQLAGTSRSMGGMDMDVVDVTSKLTAGDTVATIHASTTGDVVMFATFVTSISTFKPDFNSSNKTVVDLNGGAALPGDVLEYTITATNSGNDASTGTVLTDALPAGITYVAGSTTLDGVAISDSPGNDVGEYDAATRTITVRLGAGATSAAGGTLGIGESVVVKFQATLDPTAPSSIANQAIITAGGALGAPPGDTPTDGNGSNPGTPPTTITVDKCASDADCASPTPRCDTAASPKLCVGCLTSTDCGGATPVCGAAQACVACGPSALCGANQVCAPTGACLPDADGDGLSDADEGAIGTDPNDADSDDDGVADGQEPSAGVDSDGDGLVNARDPDSDNDGIFDGTELGLACAGAGLDVTKGTCVADADAGATKTDPLVADTDKGGVRDGAEDVDHDGMVDAGETDPNSAADDGTNVDTDGDGLSDAEEAALTTSPTDADSDDDGVPDGQEVNPSTDTDGDGRINALDEDSDGDGLFDGTELGLGCSSDATSLPAGKCVADADSGATKTSPVLADTDGGGKLDGLEDASHDGKIGPGETDPNDPSDDSGSGSGGAAGAAGAGGAGAAGKAGAGGAGAAGKAGAGGTSGGAGAAGKAGAGGTSGGAGAAGKAGGGGTSGGAGAAGKSGAGGTSGGAGAAGKAGGGGAAGKAGAGGAGAAGKAGAAGATAGSAGKAGGTGTGTGAGAGGAPQASSTPGDMELEGAGLCSVPEVRGRDSGSALALLSLLGLAALRRRRG